jgi:tetratricopeptide (TPR) repeat protein
MTPDEKNHLDGSTRIKPAPIDLSGQLEPPQPPRRGRLSVSIALGSLAAIAAGFLLIPRAWLRSPEAPQGRKEARAPSAPPAAAAASSTQVRPGPREERQTRSRQEADQVSGRMLEAKKTLEMKHVEVWAPELYASAAARAKAGDAEYRARDFEKATARYREALAAFEELVHRAQASFAAELDRGRKALSSGDSAAAVKAFATALLIRPDDPDAATGARRAKTLDDVLALIARGDEHLHDGRVAKAERSYEKARALDPDSQSARERLETVQRTLANAAFTGAMSRGYAALETGDLGKARKAFTEATKARPEATDARDALSETERRIASERIDQLLSEARAFEGSEHWREAATRYDAALSLDPNVVRARDGKRRADLRAALDDRLEQTLAHPERLADESVWRAASALLDQAARIDPPGPGLAKQIAALRPLLRKAATPVTVRFLSDKATNVTIYRVGELGRFESRMLALRPGRYVAVGSRPGYRDVRLEFMVSPDAPARTVTVECEQAIAWGS